MLDHIPYKVPSVKKNKVSAPLPMSLYIPQNANPNVSSSIPTIVRTDAVATRGSGGVEMAWSNKHAATNE